MQVNENLCCVGGFNPGVINERWGMRLPNVTIASGDGADRRYLASERARSAHPDDALDQAMHDNGVCSCFSK